MLMHSGGGAPVSTVGPSLKQPSLVKCEPTSLQTPMAGGPVGTNDVKPLSLHCWQSYGRTV